MALSLEDPTRMQSANAWLAFRARNLGSGDPGSFSTYLAAELEPKKPLCDHPDYYGGFKGAYVKDPGTISRRMSDFVTGQLSPITQTLVLSDASPAHAGRFWAYLKALHGGNLNDAEFWYYVISDHWMARGGDPRLLNRGFVAANPNLAALTMQFAVRDVFGNAAHLHMVDPQIPQRPIRGANFTGGEILFPNYIDPDPFNPRRVPIIPCPCNSDEGGSPAVSVVNGAAGTICVNEMTWADDSIWVFGIVSGHDHKGGIRRLHQPDGNGDPGTIPDDDPDVCWPGKPGGEWATINPSGAALYTDWGSSPTERFTGFAVKGDRAKAFKDGSRPIFADVDGPTDTADGTGTEMTKAHVLKPWALKNFVLRSPGYLSGAYFTTWPTFEYFPGSAELIPVGNDDSFARSLLLADSLGGISWARGVLGAGGQSVSMTEAIAMLERSSGSRMGWSQLMQLTDYLFDFYEPSFLRTDVVLDVDARIGILSDPAFSEEQKPEWFFNNLHLLFGMDPHTGRHVGDVEPGGNAEQFLQHSSRFLEFSAPFLARQSAGIVAQMMLDLFSAEIASLSKWARTWAGLEDDLGDGRLVTHRNGNGGRGYQAAKHWIIGQDYQIAAGRTIAAGLHVDRAALTF